MSDNLNINFECIKILEEDINYLNHMKFELSNNKPYWFQKRKILAYNKLLEEIDKKIKIYNDILLNEYLKMEQKK